MKTINKFLLFALSLFVISACEDYINNTDPLIDRVEDERMTNEAQVPFLITGVQQRFSVVASELGAQSDLLADMLTYTNDNPDASFPQFEEIDRGIIALNNNSTTGTWNDVNAFRFLADTLGIRISQINFADATLKTKAQFTSNLYGGIARFWLATSFGLTQDQPGAAINAGPFIPAATLIDDAIQKMKLALDQTSDAAMKKVVSSLIAKVYLAKSDYVNAANYAKNGMASGDAAFNALNSDVSQVYHWGFAGNGRAQITVDQRFHDYVVADPKEESRIKLSPKKGKSGTMYYFQIKYPDKSSPYVVMTWQENNLMLAELALRGQATGDALTLVNAVRTSHGLDPLATIDIAGIMVERDKELFVQGTRLMDQHRTNNWHLSADTWKYLPIPQTERDANSNF